MSEQHGEQKTAHTTTCFLFQCEDSKSVTSKRVIKLWNCGHRLVPGNTATVFVVFSVSIAHIDADGAGCSTVRIFKTFLETLCIGLHRFTSIPEADTAAADQAQTQG